MQSEMQSNIYVFHLTYEANDRENDFIPVKLHFEICEIDLSIYKKLK